MSIWSSFCTFGYIGPSPGADKPYLDDKPYIDFMDASDHYTTSEPDSLSSTPRGGWLGLASSGMCDLIRVNVEDERHIDVRIWLDRRQAAQLRDALSGALGDRNSGGRSIT